MDSDEKRTSIHEFLNELGPHDIEGAAVLVGFVVVCDWMDEDGSRWLSKAHSLEIPTWQAGGMLHDALNGHWEVADEEELDA